MMAVPTILLWFCGLWLRVVVADQVVLENGGSFEQLTCLHNKAKEPLPKNVVSYEVGVVKTDHASKSRTLEDMNKVEVALSYRYGFSKITSIQMKAHYTHQNKAINTTSEMTSSSVSEKLTLSVPVVGPGKTWCAYRLQSLAFQSDKYTEINLMFRDIIVTNSRIDNVSGVELILKGTKENWDHPNGYLFSTRRWGNGDDGWFMQVGRFRKPFPYIHRLYGSQGDPGAPGHFLMKFNQSHNFFPAS